MKAILILFMLFPLSSYSIGTSYSFIIKVTPKRIHVSSPNKVKKKVSVIINNESHTNLYGKVVEEGGAFLKYVAIPKKDFETVNISGFKTSKNYYFIPLSPPSQELLLKVGADSYEIPPEI